MQNDEEWRVVKPKTEKRTEQKIGRDQKLMGWSFMQMDLLASNIFGKYETSHSRTSLTSNSRFHSEQDLPEWKVELDSRCSVVRCRRMVWLWD